MIGFDNFNHTNLRKRNFQFEDAWFFRIGSYALMTLGFLSCHDLPHSVKIASAPSFKYQLRI